MKLSPNFFGPFKVVNRVGEVAYKLDQPPQSQIHNVFHVSQLKKHVGAAMISNRLPFATEDIATTKESEPILDKMAIKTKGIVVTKVLVKWKLRLPDDATWEFYYDLEKKFPNFNP